MITVAPPPSYGFQRSDFLSPFQLASKVAFWTLYGMASRVSRQYPYTAMDIEQLSLSEASSDISITHNSNDGVVPCQSQAYGKILDVVMGDHLDVVGQFPNAGGDPHSDWLPSGAGFDEARFRHVWSLVAQEIADAEAQKKRPLVVVPASTRQALSRRSKPTSSTDKAQPTSRRRTSAKLAS